MLMLAAALKVWLLAYREPRRGYGTGLAGAATSGQVPAGRRSWRSRAVLAAKVVALLVSLLTVGATIYAVVISREAYRDQHEARVAADAATATAARQQYALKVGFWVDVSKGARLPVIVVQNLGPAAIVNVTVTLQLGRPSIPSGHFQQHVALGVIPPCSVSTTVMTPRQVSTFEGGGPPSAGQFDKIAQGRTAQFRSWIVFTDPANVAWRRNGNGSLAPIKGAPGLPALVSLRSTIKAATVCS